MPLLSFINFFFWGNSRNMPDTKLKPKAPKEDDDKELLSRDYSKTPPPCPPRLVRPQWCEQYADDAPPIPAPNEPASEPELRPSRPPPHLFCTDLHPRGIAFYCRCDESYSHEPCEIIHDELWGKLVHEILDLSGTWIIDVVEGQRLLKKSKAQLRKESATEGDTVSPCSAMLDP